MTHLGDYLSGSDGEEELNGGELHLD